MTNPDQRHIYPSELDPAALRVEMSLQGMRERGVAIVAVDDPKFGADRERPVRIVSSSAQAAELVRRLQAVLDEIVL
jgi:hypothetical protein